VNTGARPTPSATESLSLLEVELGAEESPEDPASDPPGENPPRSAAALAATVAQDYPPFTPPAAAKRPAAPAAQGKDAGKPSVLGDYRLLKRLGQGGMGTVYKAHQISLDREVALKVLSKDLAARPALVQRFQREARVMARLDHPNLLRCYEVKEERGFHYLAMEYVDGGSLETWLKKRGRFSVGDALHIALACARALQHAHEQGMVHRDIKPDNVLLTSKGVVKVADLGLAKAKDDDSSVTKTGVGAGTPVYMAPEQARDAKRVDERSDIFALGSMLYCLLTGEPPFKGESVVELIEAKEKGKFPPARRFNDEVPERLDLILDKMLAAKPEQRYKSCLEVLEDLAELGLDNERLSFLGPEGETGEPPAPAAGPAGLKGPAWAPAAPPEEEPSGYFYASFKNAQGKQVTRKLTEEEVLGAIKSGSFGADTQISRSLKGGYRALATYPEFEPSLRARMTKAAADRKGQKYRAMYEQIEQEEKRRQRMRWLHNLYLRAGGFIGFLLWLAILAGACVGAYFLIRWAFNAAGEWLNKL
jgi:serine/threonine-protein kinase